MCGIIGIFNVGNSDELAKKGLALMLDRGKDGSAVFEDKNGVLGHSLHSVVGKVKQPFVGAGRFISNCEIYNWKELCERYKIEARNDAELIFKLIERKGVDNLKEILDELDGDFAFAYWLRNKVYLARDLIGVKPIWFSFKNSKLVFCSERKVLVSLGFENIYELNPRHILIYDIKTGKIKYDEIKFFDIQPELKEDYNILKSKLKGLLISSVAKRIPDTKFGILFSGGVDSSLIALICKELGVDTRRQSLRSPKNTKHFCDFKCYVGAVSGFSEAEDLRYARKAAKLLNVELVEGIVEFKDVEKYLKRVLPLIESNNVIKAGVALTFFAACEKAKKDGIRVIFSGVGSEDLFAGYERHIKANDINKDCLSGILRIYERDLYRDDVVTMANNLELRVPFLDKSLVDYSIKIPAKYKFEGEIKKKILRECAEELGLASEIAFRKRRAAQYGSNFDKAIEKLAKKNNKNKSAYLLKFHQPTDVHLGVLFSSGKDSTYAMHLMKNQNYKISCLISLESSNKDSYMFHTPNISLVKSQSKCLNIPLVLQKTEGFKEDELKDLERAIIKAKEKFFIEGIVTGAVYSNYQRERIENICDKLGLKIFSPLWHHEQEKLLRELLRNKFRVIISSIACDGLSEKWLGRVIDLNAVDELVKLNKKIGINVAGEGGEYESLVLDCPMFNSKIEIVEAVNKMESEFAGRFDVKKIRLVKK